MPTMDFLRLTGLALGLPSSRARDKLRDLDRDFDFDLRVLKKRLCKNSIPAFSLPAEYVALVPRPEAGVRGHWPNSTATVGLDDTEAILILRSKATIY